MDAKQIWADVVGNRTKLSSCIRHKFTAIEVRIGQKQTCENCGGIMWISDIGYYIMGYEAAGGNADDIWHGFHKPKAAPEDGNG